jgi:hypothetical protein
LTEGKVALEKTRIMREIGSRTPSPIKSRTFLARPADWLAVRLCFHQAVYDFNSTIPHDGQRDPRLGHGRGASR